MKKIHNAISAINEQYLLDAIRHADVSNAEQITKRRGLSNARRATALSLAAAVVMCFGLLTVLLTGQFFPGGGTVDPSTPSTDPTPHTETSPKITVTATPSPGTPSLIDTQHATLAEHVKYSEAGSLDLNAFSTDYRMDVKTAEDEKSDTDGTIPIFKIDSLSILDDFIVQYEKSLPADQPSTDLPSFTQIAEEYDEAFFAEHSLLVALVSPSQPGNDVCLNDYSANASVCEIEFMESGTDSSSPSNTEKFVILEVPNEEISACTEYRAYLKPISDNTEPVPTKPVPEEHATVNYNGLILTENVTSKSYSVIGYDCATLPLYVERNMIPESPATTARFYLPSSCNGLPITVIGEGAFADCTYFNEIVLPDCIRTIGGRAFDGCGIYCVYFIPAGCTQRIGSKSLRYIKADENLLKTVLGFDASSVETLSSIGSEIRWCPYYETKTFDVPFIDGSGNAVTAPLSAVPNTESAQKLISAAYDALREQYRSFSSIPREMLLVKYLPTDSGRDVVTFTFCLGGMETECVFTYVKDIRTGDFKCKESHDAFSEFYKTGITKTLMAEIDAYFAYECGADLSVSDLHLEVRDGRCCIVCSTGDLNEAREAIAYLRVAPLPVVIN